MTKRSTILFLLITTPCFGQTQSIPDSIRLPTLRNAALASDPRASQLEIIAAQSSLRLQSLNAELRPALSLDAQAQYQSDIAAIPVRLPGVTIPTPAHATYDSRLSAQQRLYDPSLATRRAVERAQTTESQARVRTALYAVNEAVSSAFFTALRSQNQAAEMSTTVTDLEAQLAVADSRVKAGTALPSEVNAIRAELLRRRQAVSDQDAVRRAAIAVLSSLTGSAIDPRTPLAAPDIENPMPAAGELRQSRQRPEYQQFALSRESLQRLEDARRAQDKPRLSAFGRLGYGRPGLNLLGNQFDTWWLTGVQLQWSPWNWGTSQRDRQVIALQRRMVSAEEQSFTNTLNRILEQDLVSIDRIESALPQDDEIIALRENIFAETRARYAEGVITSAEYVDRQTDVLAARLARAAHRVELLQARAHLLSTLGLEVR